VNAADLRDLFALETACFADFWSEKVLSEVLQDPNHLVLLRRDEFGAATAYFIGRLVADEAEIERIGVAPAARGRGLGGEVLDEALETWRDLGAMRVFLEVRASNFVAQQLYVSRGFEIVAKRARYYDDGEDALIFGLEIGA
jgi:ribosomal-protein-alanine N-acetyltransferase